MSDQRVTADRLVVVTLTERPELKDKVFAPEIQSAMPQFMRHDRNASLYDGDGRLDRFLECGLAALDPAEPDGPVARALGVAFCVRDGRPERTELPESGWGEVIRRGDADHTAGSRPNTVSALEITVAPRLHDRAVYVEPDLWVHHRVS